MAHGDALEVLVSSQLLDIEQTAALKKLEAEAMFGDQQAQIERDSTLRKLDAETEFEQRKAEAKARALEVGTEAKMTEWLARNRLSRHGEILAAAAGADAAPSDLVFLTEQDIEELGSGMNRVEKRRLEAALQALREEGEEAAADAE